MKSPLIAVLALLCGVVGGVVGARAFGPTKTVETVVQAAPPTSTVDQGAPASSGSTDTSQAPMSWVEVARRAGPAVVTIINQQATQGYDMFGNPIPGGTAEGSGFIVNRQGDIVTNNHVVEGEQSLTVVFSNGHKVPAKLVRTDVTTDLAVIKINPPVSAVLRFGDSSKLQPGEPVLAIGSALGEFRNSVTSGVVSALGRTITEPNNVALHDMIQTDAAINQGNSGGPLLDDHGEVVGVNTAINRGSSGSDPFGLSQQVVAEGLGFAIPESTVKNVAARLMQNKPTPVLGVEYRQITQQDAAFYNFPQGAYVTKVLPGSPADKAGIKLRDIITAIDGQALHDMYTLQRTISAHSVGDTITIKVWRSGQTKTVRAKLTAKS